MMLPQNPDQASLADAADLAALLDLVLNENTLCDRFADASAGDGERFWQRLREDIANAPVDVPQV